MSEQIFSNARIVLEDRIVDGSVVVRDGLIAVIDEGPSRTGEDLGGDYLIPGLVELHTDHLESHYSPRPGVRRGPVHARPAQSSVLMYSATALTSSSVSFDATECMTSLSLVRSRVLKDFNCDSV